MNRCVYVFAFTCLACSLSNAQAYRVYGAIEQKWRQLGGASGPLGPAQSDEAAAARGGRFNNFKNGFIYWTPQTGAHAVYGLIGEKWNQLGRERGFGYPLTDEQPAASGGRYNDFESGGSIYWKPATGAHEVHGLIREKWLSLGGASGPLGYPVTDEFQEGSFRRSNFEHGRILWSAQTGAQAFYPPHVLETLTDRCSGDVIIASRYTDSLSEALWSGAILMTRGWGRRVTAEHVRGLSDTAVLPISGHTWIRWWCYGDDMGMVDYPGVWRLSNGEIQAGCTVDVTTGTVYGCSRYHDDHGFGFSLSRAGWTAERSRCASSSTIYIDARLGSGDRLLEIRCLGH